MKYSPFLSKRDEEIYQVRKDLLVPVPSFPKVMLIEVTNACNHACSFCANKEMTRKRGSIDLSLLDSILVQSYRLGTREVGFYSTGEPFLYKHIDAAVRRAKEIGMEYVYVTTNGALLDEKRIKRSIESGLDSIKFSINAATRETYKVVHGHDDFYKVVRNIKFIKEYRDRHDIPLKIGISYVLSDENRNERELAARMFANLADDVGFYERANQGGYMNQNVGSQSSAKAPCALPFNRFHVTYEGYFTLCCVDFQNYLAVADLNSASLSEAWSSPLAVEMRVRHVRSELSGTLCHNCTQRTNDDIKPLVPRFATEFCFK